VPQRTPTRLYTSPLGRARDTARHAERALGLQAEVEEWTRELSSWGRAQQSGGEARAGEGGIALWDIPGDRLRALKPAPTMDNQFTLLPELTPAEAPYAELCAHSDAFLARHGYVRDGAAYRVERRSEEQLAVFCHGGFGVTWLAHLLQLPLPLAYAAFHLPPSSVTTVLFDERSPGLAAPRLLGLGDVGHLYKAQLPIAHSKYEKPNEWHSGPRPSGVKANFW